MRLSGLAGSPQSTKIAVRWQAACAALPKIAGLALAVALSACGNDARPTDAAMMANLRARLPLFEQLVAMVVEDRDLERVDVDWTRPDDPATVGVTPARIAAYRTLMKQAGIARGFSAYRPRKIITFIAHVSGFLTHGTGKSYVYVLPGQESERYGFDIEPGDLEAAASGQRDFHGYRHVQGNWYLLLDSH